LVQSACAREDYSAISSALRAADSDLATRVGLACYNDEKLAGLMLSFESGDSEFSVLDALLADESDTQVKRIEIGMRLQAEVNQKLAKP
jgi:hypothetical protein